VDIEEKEGTEKERERERRRENERGGETMSRVSSSVFADNLRHPGEAGDYSFLAKT